MTYICPVCGYQHLHEQPRGEKTGGSQEICPSCGIQFGYDDEAGGDPVRRLEVYERWRRDWIASGMKWQMEGHPQPANWNPVEQLRLALGQPQR